MKKDGKEFESLVKLIEESLDPHASIRHNEFLPVLTSKSGASRQCDVVIRKGGESRETITIIEVQDRTSQVDINTFGGWLKKLDQVGAQHLICVSKRPFPESIKEEAILSGNKVQLINFNEATPDKIPFNFLNFKFTHSELNIKGMNDIQIKVSVPKEKYNHEKHKEEININLTTKKKIFSFDKVNLLNIYDFILNDIDLKKVEPKGIYNISITKDNGSSPLYYLEDGDFFQIEMLGEIIYDIEVTEFPTSIINYEQINHGNLAWVWECRFERFEKIYWIKTPIIPVGDEYRLGQSMGNLPDDINLTLRIDPPIN